MTQPAPVTSLSQLDRLFAELYRRMEVQEARKFPAAVAAAAAGGCTSWMQARTSPVRSVPNNSPYAFQDTTMGGVSASWTMNHSCGTVDYTKPWLTIGTCQFDTNANGNRSVDWSKPSAGYLNYQYNGGKPYVGQGICAFQASCAYFGGEAPWQFDVWQDSGGALNVIVSVLLIGLCFDCT